MRRVLAGAAAICLVTAGGAFAADPKVDAAVKTFDAIGAAPDKLEAYCAMSKKMSEIGDDEKKAEAASAEMNGYYDKLGADFEEAFAAGDELPENSPDLEILSQSLTKLDEACPK
ncbi:MAG: hypothetical protein ACKVP4_01195 [Hyphomicrobium sp.]